MRYRFEARLWLHDGDAAWHFVTLPADIADEVMESTRSARRGFGSVRVRVNLGDTTWSTSLFPDTAAKSYVLPIKRQVRAAERIHAGDLVSVVIDLAQQT